jgi:hypothetical protein
MPAPGVSKAPPSPGLELLARSVELAPAPAPAPAGAVSEAVSKSVFRRLVAYKTKSAFTKVLASRYLKANIVNLVYCIIMMVMDVAVYSEDFEGLAYLLLAVIHCINATMYLWVWRGERQNIFSMFCLPDWLNGVCAAFYLGTGFCAPYLYDGGGHPTDIFRQVRRIELFLSVLECVAAVGWVYQWYAEFVKDLRVRPKQSRGRGWTLDDPDLWGNMSLVIAANFYIVYNIVICLDHYKYYNTSTLYFWGDFWYLVNALCYILCSLRDCECFWFMPRSGHFPDYVRMADECGLLNPSEQSEYNEINSHKLGQSNSDGYNSEDASTLDSNLPAHGILARLNSRRGGGFDLEGSGGEGGGCDEEDRPLLADTEDKQRV